MVMFYKVFTGFTGEFITVWLVFWFETFCLVEKVVEILEVEVEISGILKNVSWIS